MGGGILWEIPAKISAVILRISQEEMIISNIKKIVEILRISAKAQLQY